MSLADCHVAEDPDFLRQWIERVVPEWFGRDFTLLVNIDGKSSSYVGDGGNRGKQYTFGCLQDVALGLLAVSLDDDGVVSIDRSVVDYVPEIASATTWPTEISLRHLVARASGIWVGDRVSPSDSREWPIFVQRLLESELSVQPGSLVVHSLVDRIIALKAIQRASGVDPYVLMKERVFRGSTDLTFEDPVPGLSSCYSELRGSLADISQLMSGWADRIGAAEPRYAIVLHPAVNSWAPQTAALGMYRMTNGIWGQDGDVDAISEYVGLRTSPDGRVALFGQFSNPFQRARVLTLLCGALMGVAPPLIGRTIGHLGSTDARELVGAFQGEAGGIRLSIELEGDELQLRMGDSDKALPIEIRDDGSLGARWALTNLWIEPRALPEHDRLLFIMGRHTYMKV